MRFFLAVIAGLLIAGAPARAVTSEAVELDAGPGAEGRRLDPVWVMRCSDGRRLVGIRLHDDGRLAGIGAICAKVRMDDAGARWLGGPALLPEPAPPTPPVTQEVTRVVRQEGTILRADSAGVTRQRGSRALMITIREPVGTANDAAETPPVDRIEFRDARGSDDLMCPADHVIVGLRIGSRIGGRTARVAALQIICGNGLGRVLEPIGAWPKETAATAKKTGRRKRAKAALPLQVQRIECGVSDANPHDGRAARAIFGTEADGRVETIGLSCAGRLDSLRPHSRLYAAVRGTARDALRAMGWATRIDGPKWFDGASVAVCESGRDRSCVQLSADRYCSDVAGYDRATAFAIGRFASDAVAPGGQRCPRGTCRAFSSITCAL